MLHESWKLTLCNLRWRGCITTGRHFHCSCREAEVLNFSAQVQHIRCVGVSSRDRKRWREKKKGLRTVYNIRVGINFSWSGYSFQHIHHSCTVTWLSPADPHPGTHTTIKTRASCEPAALAHCTVQQSGAVREAAWTSEMFECSTYITIPLVLSLLFFFFFFGADRLPGAL